LSISSWLFLWIWLLINCLLLSVNVISDSLSLTYLFPLLCDIFSCCQLTRHHSHHPQLPHSFTVGLKPTSFYNFSHHGVSSGLRTDSTALWQDHFVCASLVFVFSFLTILLFLFFGSVRQIKLVTSRPSGARKYSLPYGMYRSLTALFLQFSHPFATILLSSGCQWVSLCSAIWQRPQNADLKSPARKVSWLVTCNFAAYHRALLKCNTVLIKGTTPPPFRLSAACFRTFWTVDCTTTVLSTRLSATTLDVTTQTDSGSNASNRRVCFPLLLLLLLLLLLFVAVRCISPEG